MSARERGGWASPARTGVRPLLDPLIFSGMSRAGRGPTTVPDYQGLNKIILAYLLHFLLICLVSLDIIQFLPR